MTLLSIPPLIMSIIVLHMGISHLLSYKTNKKRHINLTFAVMCFSVGLYSLFCVGNYNATTHLQGYEWQRLQLFALALVAVSLLLYVSDYTGIRKKYFIYFWTLFFGFSGFVQLADRSDLTWIVSQPLIKTFEFFGHSVTYFEVTHGPFTDIQAYGLLCFFLYIYWHSFYFLWKQKVSTESLFLILAVTVFFLSLCEDVMVSAGFYHFIYTLEYGYVGFLLIMGYRQVMDNLRVQEELFKSEETHRALIENLHQRVFYKDIRGVYVSCNLNYALDLGIHPKEIAGKTDFDFFPKELAEKYRAEDMKVIESGDVVDVEEPYIRGGIEFSIQCVKTPIRDDGKKIIGVMGIFWDITARRKAGDALLEREERYRIIAEKTGQMLYDYNVLTQKIEWSGAVESILGYSLKEFARVDIKKWSEMVHPEDKQVTIEFLDEAMEKCGKYDTEYRFARKDGSYVHIEDHGVYLPNKDGKACRMLGTMSDVTERKKVEKDLRLTQASIDNASTNIFWLDKEGRFVYVNDCAVSSLGYTKEELLSMHVWDIDPFMPRDRWPGHWENMKTKKTFHFEMAHRRKDGSQFPVDIHANYIQYKEQEYIFSFVRDISEDKRIQESIRVNQEKYRAMFESSKAGMALCRMDGALIECNQAYFDMIGYTKEEALQLTYWDLTPGEFKEKEFEQIGLLESTGRYGPYEKEYIRKDGQRIPVLLSGVLVKGVDGKDCIWSVVQNITERKEIENDLEKAKDTAEKYLNIVGVMIVRMNVKKEVTLINKKGCEILGYEREEIIGKNWFDHFVPLRLREEVSGVADQILKDEIDPAEYYENPVVTKSGEERIIAWHNVISKGQSGEVAGILSSGEDITERRKFEEDIRAQESFMTNIFSSTQDGISVLNKDMRILRVNPKMEEWYAHKMPLVGKICFDAYHNRDKKCEICPTTQVLKTKAPAYEVVPKVGPNGKACGWQELFAFPFLDSKSGEMLGVIEYVRDITERRQAEDDLKQALEEKDTLLKEVHHRVKNNLLTLYSLVNLQQIALGRTGDAAMALEDMKRRISAMGKVHRMLYLSKSFTKIDFAEYIQSLMDEIKEAYSTDRGDIDITLDLDPVVFNIDTAIPCGLLVNEIVVNSFKHAFPGREGGRVTVSLKDTGKDIELKVGDNGKGMADDPLEEKNKTLGLKLVGMLSKQIGAKITYSRKGGSLFTIIFKNVTIDPFE